MDENEIRKAVRDGYADIARRSGGCCGPATPCCGGPDTAARNIGRDIGYSEQDLKAAPEGANKVEQRFPEVKVYTASIDEKLNEYAYIVPGLGDAGDRLLGTV